MKDGHQIDQISCSTLQQAPENFKEDHLGDVHLAKQTRLISAVGLFLGADPERTPFFGGVVIKHSSLNGHVICLESGIIIPASKTKFFWCRSQ